MGNKIDEIIEKIPSKAEIRDRLCANLRERDLLRKLLKIAEQRDKVEEARSCQK